MTGTLHTLTLRNGQRVDVIVHPKVGPSHGETVDPDVDNVIPVVFDAADSPAALCDELRARSAAGEPVRHLLVSSVLDGVVDLDEAAEVADELGVDRVDPVVRWIGECCWCGEEVDMSHLCPTLAEAII